MPVDRGVLLDGQPASEWGENTFAERIRLARQRFNNTRSAYMSAIKMLDKLRDECPHEETERLKQGMTSLKICQLCGEVLS